MSLILSTQPNALLPIGLVRMLAPFLTNQETYFFREPRVFDFSAKFLLERRKENLGFSRSPSLKAWCAGCSSGEEAYSLAIFLKESGFSEGDISILGTDISDEALMQAATALYTRRSFRSLGEESRYEDLLKRYLKPRNENAAGDVREVCESLKPMVLFDFFNLVDFVGEDKRVEREIAEGFDLIICRNVLVYFEKAEQMMVVESLSNSLKTGGYLIIAPTDLVHGLPSETCTHLNLAPTGALDGCVYVKNSRPVAYNSPALEPWTASDLASARELYLQSLKWQELDLKAEAIESLEKCLVLNSDMHMASFMLAGLYFATEKRDFARALLLDLRSKLSALPLTETLEFGEGLTIDSLLKLVDNLLTLED
ncbi:MAG: hypothetical protein K2Y32_04850 [Candidatus Obscuribacterales bacterium]|nr:hypothetical protein [Candidatus Obscuribacterales bacterium]